MKRLVIIMLIMLSVQSINAQRHERPSIYYSKEETYEYLKDYVGLWQFEDTLERLVFRVELVTNDTGHRIILKGRYSILKSIDESIVSHHNEFVPTRNLCTKTRYN